MYGLLERLCSLKRQSAIIVFTTSNDRGFLLARDVVKCEDTQRNRSEHNSQGTIIDPQGKPGAVPVEAVIHLQKQVNKKSRIATRLTYYGERRESLKCCGDSREVCEFTLAEDSARFASFGAHC